MKLTPYSAAEIEAEFQRLQRLAASPQPSSRDGCAAGVHAGSFLPQRDAAKIRIPSPGCRSDRQHRQFDELAAFSQAVVRKSWFVRQALWAKTEHLTPEQWSAMAPEYRSKLWDGPIGRLPKVIVCRSMYALANPSQDPRWDGYEVVYDVAPDVFGYGVLLVPKGIGPANGAPLSWRNMAWKDGPGHVRVSGDRP